MEQAKEIILFVDDEDYLAEVGKEMLEDYGYTVDIETDPVNAHAMFEKDPDRYDLLITDYTMPGMNGGELAEKLRALRNNLPVILCSGTRLDPAIKEGSGAFKVLLKPFDMDMLLMVVRDTLDAVPS